MFYVLASDSALQLVGTVHGDNNDLISPLAIGDPIENPSRLYVTVEVAPSIYPDYFELQQIPIVSRKFMNAISKRSLEGISFYPIRIHEKSHQIDDYFVFLVSKKIAAVNHERSTVTRLGKQIIRIKNLCLKPLSADLEIFRLQELAFVILISDRIVEEIKDMNGIVISEAEGWSDRSQF